jgi:hypothetical protein
MRSLLTTPSLITTLTAAVPVTAVGLYLWLKGRTSARPDYANDLKTWFVREADGDKEADVFYAHPTTGLGLLRWNLAWEDMGGDKCTGPVAGDPDLITGQAGAWRTDCNIWAPK